MKTICGWCGILMSETPGASPLVSHGICPACIAKIDVEIEATLTT